MRRGLQLIAVLCALLGAAGRASAQDRSLEFPVKAAFLYKFGSFIDWPPGVFPGPKSPVQLCVVGRDPFGGTLDRVVQGQTINTRPIAVKRIDAIGAGSGCHIAFLGGSAEQSVAAAARAVAGAPVLTVADDGSPDERVAVQFAIRANRVRFRIDQRVAAAAGLNVSSKLLNLAMEVVR